MRAVAATLLLAAATVARADLNPPPARTDASAPDEIDRRLQADLEGRVVRDCFLARARPSGCTLRGDFDGDGAPDVALLVRDATCARPGRGCRRGIAVLRGRGGAFLLGITRARWRRVELDGTAPVPEPIPADFSFLARWETRRAVTRDGARVLLGPSRPSPNRRPLALPGLRGDALLIDGGDAAVLVYRAADGWRVYDLGY